MTSSETQHRLRDYLPPSVGRVGIAVLALLLVAISFALEGHLFINFGDEGFLWYGTWRTSLGEVPIRDFHAYDPGRYYWGAFWFQFLGDGIVALRISNAIFQCMGLICGLLVLQRLSRRLDFLAASGLILLVWMHPRHKLFDVSIAMAAIYVVLCLFERPNLKRHFAAGVLVGIAAFFGRNHGLYVAIGVGLAIAFSSLRQGGLHWIRRVLQSGAGVLVGYSPMILMALLVPGFFESVTDRLTIMLERGATNVSLPIPWPWTVWTSPPPYIKTLGLDPLAGYIVGFFYLIWFVFLAAVGLFMLRDREPLTQARAVLVAATLVSLPYLHHASARAGITHLAQSIHPLLIGLIAAAYLIPRIRFSQAVPVTVIALMLMSAASIVTLNPAYKRYSSRSNIFKLAVVGEDEIVLRKDIAREVRVAERIGKEFVAPDESVFIAPRLPAYYPIMRRKSPVKETYLTVKESAERQKTMLEDLEAANVRWAIIGDRALDDRDALRFQNTHPLVWSHIVENFEPIEVKGIRKQHTLFKRRE